MNTDISENNRLSHNFHMRVSDIHATKNKRLLEAAAENTGIEIRCDYTRVGSRESDFHERGGHFDFTINVAAEEDYPRLMAEFDRLLEIDLAEMEAEALGRQGTTPEERALRAYLESDNSRSLDQRDIGRTLG